MSDAGHPHHTSDTYSPSFGRDYDNLSGPDRLAEPCHEGDPAAAGGLGTSPRNYVRARSEKRSNRQSEALTKAQTDAWLRARRTAAVDPETGLRWSTGELRRDALQFEARRVLTGTGHGVCHCQTSVCSVAAGVGIKVKASGAAKFTGLQLCGSAWVCPNCARVVARERHEEVETILDHAAMARRPDPGPAGRRRWGGKRRKRPLRLFAALLTLTVSHSFDQSLKFLIDGLAAAKCAWRRLTAWQSRKDYIKGTVDAFEAPFGVHGWHPHYHVLILVWAHSEAEAAELLDPKGVPARRRRQKAELAELRDLRDLVQRVSDPTGLRTCWKHTGPERAAVEALRVRRRAAPRGSAERAVVMAEIETMRAELQARIEVAKAAVEPSTLREDWIACVKAQGLSGGAVAFDVQVKAIHRRAMKKGANGRPVAEAREGLADYVTKWGMADELTRPGEKLSRGQSRNQWELLQDGLAGDAAASARFLEFGLGTWGKRRMVFSNGLRSWAGLDEEPAPDDEVVDDDASAADEWQDAGIIDTPIWRRLMARRCRAQLLDAAREGMANGGGPEGAERAVWALINRILAPPGGFSEEDTP